MSGTEVANRPAFDIAQWSRLHRAETERDAELHARLTAIRLVPKITVAHVGAGLVTAVSVEVLTGPVGALIATAATPAATALAWATARLVVRHRITEQWAPVYRRAAILGISVELGWGLMVQIPALGVQWWPVAALVVLIGALRVSVPWRKAHSLTPRPTLPAAPEPPQIEPAEVPESPGGKWALLRARVLTDVFGDHGPLAGVRFTSDWEDLGRGCRWLVQLPPGVPFSSTRGCEEQIAAALHMPTDVITWDRVVSDASQAKLAITTEDLLAPGVPYGGPEYHDGQVPIGLLKDGVTRACLTVADESGVHCAAFTGGQRQGKSTAFTAGMLGTRKSGLWINLFADGDTGRGSSPTMIRKAYWPVAGPEGALRQLMALEGIGVARAATMGTLTRNEQGQLVRMHRPDQTPVDKLLPCKQFPGIGWWLDEFHTFVENEDLAAVDFVGRIVKLIKLYAKYGIAVYAANHSLLRASWGTTELLAALTLRNQFAFRNVTSSQSVTIGGETYRLDELPDKGYFVARGDEGDAVVGRGAFPLHTDDDDEYPELDEPSRLGAGPYWPTEQRDATTEYWERVETERLWREQAKRIAAGEDPDAPKIDEPEDYSGYGNAVIPLRPAPFCTAVTETTLNPMVVAAAADERLNDTDRKVLAAVHGGHVRSYQIVNHTGLKGPAVSKSAAKLAELGYLTDGGHGKWALPEGISA